MPTPPGAIAQYHVAEPRGTNASWILDDGHGPPSADQRVTKEPNGVALVGGFSAAPRGLRLLVVGRHVDQLAVWKETGSPGLIG
jgi:hypothetical protein